MWTVVYLILVLSLGLFLKNNKFTNLLLLLTVFVLFAFEKSDADYQVYLTTYDAVGTGRVWELYGYEPSFLLFCTLGNKYNLSFDLARGIICVFEILALGSTVKLFTKNIAVVFSLFFIFPAMFDAELFRWLSGMCLIIYAFPYLIRGQNKYDYIMYVALVLLATSLHTSCIFFLMYLMVLMKDEKKIISIVVILSIIGVVTSQTGLLYKLFSILPIQQGLNEKFQKTTHSNIFGVISLALRSMPVFFAGFLVTFYCKRHKFNLNIIRDNRGFKLSRAYDGFGALLCSKLKALNIVTLLLIVVAIYTPQVQRVFHVMLFFNYVALAYLLEKKICGLGGQILSVLNSVLLLLLMFVGSDGVKIVFMSHFNEGFLVNLFECI